MEHHMKKAILLLLPLLIAIIVVLFHPDRLIAQQPPQPPQQQDLTVDNQIRGEVIENLLRELNDSYVFPETAKKMEADIRDRVKKNEYDQVTSARAFAEKLT